jgi:hypothetical protein
VSLTRRELLADSLRAIALASLLAGVTRRGAWAAPIQPAIRRWMLRLGEIGRAVHAGELAPRDWQTAMDALYAEVSLEELAAFIDVDRLLAGLAYPKEKLGAVVNVPWPALEGFPADLPFGHKLFVYRKGSVTPPHAHNHMVSAHFVLRGEVRARTFDRVQDLDRAILIRPTRDAVCRPGALVTMSDARDNVHWFEGVSETSISFDVPVVDLELAKQYRHPAEAYNQIYLDPTVAPRADGAIEAPLLKFDDSVRKFA